MIFFACIGGSYFERQLIQIFNLNLPILSQNGLSEWLLLIFTTKASQLININIEILNVILGITSGIISIGLFVRLSSISPEEIKFFKFKL